MRSILHRQATHGSASLTFIVTAPVPSYRTSAFGLEDTAALITRQIDPADCRCNRLAKRSPLSETGV